MWIHELKLFIKNYDFYVVSVKQHCARICLDIDGWIGLRQGCCMDMMEKCFLSITDGFNSSTGLSIANKVVQVSFP